MDIFCSLRGFLLALRRAFLVFLVAMTCALAAEPFEAWKAERAMQEEDMATVSRILNTVILSPSDSPSANGSLNVGFALPANQAIPPQAPAAPSGALHGAIMDFGSIPGMQTYLQALTACVLIFSAFVSWRTARITRFNVQVDAFQKLRSTFALLRPKLPRRFWTLEELPEDYEELCAMERYWHQSFDEWFITQVLHRRTLGYLWRTYYKDAILKSRESPAMIAALIRAKEGTDAEVDERFFRVIVFRWGGITKISNYKKAEELAETWDAHLAAQKNK